MGLEYSVFAVAAGRFLCFPALGFVREGSLEGVDGSLHWLRIRQVMTLDFSLSLESGNRFFLSRCCKIAHYKAVKVLINAP